jgi:hypothetical protein
MGEADIRGKKGGEGYANARRVDMRLLTPWSSWEDQAQLEVPGDDAGAASPPTTDASAPGLRPSPSGQRLDDAPNRNAAGTALREILNTISKEDLGGRD